MDGLINFIREIGVDNFIRLLAFGTILIIATSLFFFSRAVYVRSQRGNPAQDVLNKAFEHQQERLDELDDDITKNSAEKLRLLGEKVLLEGQLKICQEQLAAKRASGLTIGEENVLREMIVSLRDEVRIKDNHIARLTEERKKS